MNYIYPTYIFGIGTPLSPLVLPIRPQTSPIPIEVNQELDLSPFEKWSISTVKINIINVSNSDSSEKLFKLIEIIYALFFNLKQVNVSDRTNMQILGLNLLSRLKRKAKIRLSEIQIAGAKLRITSLYKINLKSIFNLNLLDREISEDLENTRKGLKIFRKELSCTAEKIKLGPVTQSENFSKTWKNLNDLYNHQTKLLTIIEESDELEKCLDEKVKEVRKLLDERKSLDFLRK